MRETVDSVFGCSPELLAETVIISPFISPDLFAKKMDSVLGRFKGIFFFKGVTGTVGKCRLTAIGVPPSGNLPADALLFLKNSGVKKIVFAGSYGALDDTPRGAICMVNTVFSTNSFEEFIKKGRLELGARYNAPILDEFKGVFPTKGIASFPSLFAETDLKTLEQFRNKGVEGVDMECASFLMALAKSRLKGGAVLFNADNPLYESIFSNKELSRKGKHLTENFVSKLVEGLCPQ